MKSTRIILITLFFLTILILNICCLHYTDYFSFEMISNHRQWLKERVIDYPIFTPIIYILIYICITAFSVPGAVFITIAGGLLFPQPWSTIYTAIGATAGATLLFLAAKTLFYDLFQKKVGPFTKKLQEGFQEDETNYLLFLRLVPLFPFWLVNLAPAFFGVRLRTFIWTTFIGILPGVFVFSQAGAGLGSVFDAKMLTLGNIFNRDIQIALAALGLFVIIPVVIKKWRKRKNND